jgi:iron complex outermembrane receptor protein
MAKPRHLLCLLPLLPTLSHPVLGQSEEPTVQRVDKEQLVLEEVLVTANRRVESLQEVPMSVSAFTGDFFENSGVRDLSDLEQYTPSLKITPGVDSRSTSIRIRGIGSVGTNVGIDPSVGMFIDGVYQGRAGMSISNLIDIERVEVLRGPQGTLYGKNTAAGAINIITRTPATDLEYELELNYDTDEKVEVNGMVNTPLGNSGHAMRLTGFLVDGDHLYENTWTGDDINDAHKWGAKSRVLIDGRGIADGADFGDFLLTVDYTREDTDCCALAVIDYAGFSTLNAPATNTPSREFQEFLGTNENGIPIMRYSAFEDSEGFSPPKADPFGDDYWFDGTVANEVTVGGVALEWNRDLGDDVITFINAWRHYESDSVYDGDFTAYNATDGDQEVDLDQYSSELRITSPGGETLDYQGGLYFYRSELDSVGTFKQFPSLIDNIPLLGIFFPDGSLNTDTNDYTTTSYALFGQLTWNINMSWSATLGLRYTAEEKDRKGSQITEPTTGLDIPPVAGPDIFYDDTRSDDDFSPSLNIRYFVTPDIMTYASVSRGFKSGGFNQRREVVGSPGEFDEETATNYELGWKGAWLDRRLQFNGTVYYVDYDDFQAQAFDGSTIRVTNAGSLESYGTEMELVFIPAVNMTVGSALGYNKAEYGEFDNGQCTVEQTFIQYYIVEGQQGPAPGLTSQCTQDLGGKELDNAPEWTLSSFLQYDATLSDDLLGIVRLEHNFIDEFYLDQDLDPKLKNDEVHLVNLRLTLTNQTGTWEATLWGRNMLDEEYYGFGIDIPVLGGYAGMVAPGEVYGLTFRLRH